MARTTTVNHKRLFLHNLGWVACILLLSWVVYSYFSQDFEDEDDLYDHGVVDEVSLGLVSSGLDYLGNGVVTFQTTSGYVVVIRDPYFNEIREVPLGLDVFRRRYGNGIESICIVDLPDCFEASISSKILMLEQSAE